MSDTLIGLHHFTAWEGDPEWVQDEITGLWSVANPVLWEASYKNLITTTGKQAYLDRLAGLSAVAAFTSLGVGTDSTAAAVGDTKLNPSVAGSAFLQAADPTFPSRTGTVLTIQTTFGTGVANFTWNEAGYFNGTTNGTSTIFNRVIIGPFAKTTASSIAYTSTITQN